MGSSRADRDHVPPEWGGTTCFPSAFFVHTFARLLPNETYFETHPEYFALIDGRRRPQGHGGGAQFCLTHPEVRRIVTRRALDELDTLHTYGIFDVSQNDTDHGFCHCPTCAALRDREGSEAGPLLDFVNYVAAVVAQKYPRVKITTLAYLETNKPPRHLRPRDNVIIRLANDTASFPYPMYFLEESDVFYPNMLRWIELGARLFIWDYVVDYKAYPMPHPNLAVIDHNIDTYARHGVYGLFLQSSHYGPGENQGALRAWVYAKKMWDPSRAMADLVRDFNYGYFGSVGGLMQQYSDLLQEEWQRFHDSHSYRDSARFPGKFQFSESFYPRARRLFDEALARSEGDESLHDKVEREFISLLFYRLQRLAPEGEAERQSYEEDLAAFARLTERHHVEWIDEGVTRTPQRIQEWRRKYDLPSDGPEEPVTLRFTPDNITRCADGGTAVDDIAAPGGRCIELPIRGDGWSLQWFFGSALLKGVEYSVRLLVRGDEIRPEGPAVGYGIYSLSERRTPLMGTLDAADLSDAGYGWLDGGTVKGEDAPSSYFYFAQIPGSSISRLYVAAVELIPLDSEAETGTAR